MFCDSKSMVKFKNSSSFANWCYLCEQEEELADHLYTSWDLMWFMDFTIFYFWHPLDASLSQLIKDILSSWHGSNVHKEKMKVCIIASLCLF